MVWNRDTNVYVCEPLVTCRRWSSWTGSNRSRAGLGAELTRLKGPDAEVWTAVLQPRWIKQALPFPSLVHTSLPSEPCVCVFYFYYSNRMLLLSPFNR